MILEVLVGTEQILACRHTKDIKRLLRVIDGYFIDRHVLKLLQALLLVNDEVYLINDFIDNVLLPNPTLIAENVRSMNEACKEEEKLRN